MSRNISVFLRGFSTALALGFCFTPLAHTDAPQETAEDIFRESGVQGGLVAFLDCGEGHLLTGLCPRDSFVVQGLARDAKDLAESRERIDAHVIPRT